jgi:hypothetical protein
MRREMAALIVLVLLPVAVFADWGVGGTVSYMSPTLLGQVADTGKADVDQLCFGGDARFALGFFEAEAMLLGSGGSINSFNIYADLGAVFDIAIVRLSLGTGPDFTSSFGTSPAVQAGVNAKISMDVMLRLISIGLTYVAAVDLNRSGTSSRAGLLGITMLHWL